MKSVIKMNEKSLPLKEGMALKRAVCFAQTPPRCPPARGGQASNSKPLRP